MHQTMLHLQDFEVFILHHVPNAFFKIANLIAECEQLYAVKIVYGNTVKMKHVKKLHTCGERNSYSKTDHDVNNLCSNEPPVQQD